MTEVRSVHIRITPRFKLKLALLLVIIVIVQLLVYSLGRQHALDNFGSFHKKQRALVHELNEKSIELKQQQTELVRVSKSAEIDRMAAEQVRQEIFDLRTQLAELQRDVEFYKGLMAPEELNKGLKLHTFSLLYDDALQRYNFKLVLANIGGTNRVVKGELGLKLLAIENGQNREVLLTDMPGYEGASPIKLRFRFFQNIAGSFRLPEGFQPTTLVAETNINDASGQPFSESYDWQELLNSKLTGGSDVW